MWGLTPQPLKPEYVTRFYALTEFVNEKGEMIVTEEWFEPKTRVQVLSEKLLTWQQFLVFRCVELALLGMAPRRISIQSGHSTGKSSTSAMLILWFLFCWMNCQIPCTAPTSQQMHDVLWKEINLWLMRMPEQVKNQYEWQDSYVRMTAMPKTWFARAQTASKDKPEALSGIHAEDVMMVIDEASGVHEEVFKHAEGSLTNPNIIVIMISNHTRLIGYFHDSHGKDKKAWQRLRFNSEKAPICDWSFVERISTKYGKDSDEYRIRVLGMPPREDAVDDQGYVQLISESDILRAQCDDGDFIGKKRMGVDPSGEGDDESVWVVRDEFKAKIVSREKTSSPKGGAAKTLTLMQEYDIAADDVFIDNFGEGSNWATELAAIRINGKPVMVKSVNVGDDAEDSERYLNRRAEAYWRTRKWLKAGGQLVRGTDWDELQNIRYRNMEGSGSRMQMMPKKDMRKLGFPSPNKADALMLTHYTPDLRMPNQKPARPDWMNRVNG